MKLKEEASTIQESQKSTLPTETNKQNYTNLPHWRCCNGEDREANELNPQKSWKGKINNKMEGKKIRNTNSTRDSELSEKTMGTAIWDPIPQSTN